MLTYYKILGIDQRSTEAQIKKAYRKLSMQFHPDKNHGQDELFKLIDEAYKVLSDSQERNKYDSSLMREQSPHVSPTAFYRNTSYMAPEEIILGKARRIFDSNIRKIKGMRKWDRLFVVGGLVMILNGIVGLASDNIRPYSNLGFYENSSQQQKHPSDYGVSILSVLGGLGGAVYGRRNLKLSNELLRNLESKRNKLG